MASKHSLRHLLCRRLLGLVILSLTEPSAIAATVNDFKYLQRLIAQARQELHEQPNNNFHGEYLPRITFPDDEIFQGDIVREGFGALAGLSLDAVRDKSRLWPNGRVPYEIADNLTSTEKRLIQAAIREFSRQTCIRFVPKNSKTNENYVRFQPSQLGCFTNSVGEKQEQQGVFLAPACFLQFGKILHEMMHVVGFYHEQMRTDRDQYVTINYTNIAKSNYGQFEKLYDDQLDDLGLPYDYGSLLHYGAYGFAIDKTVPVITPTRPLPENVKTIGQRDYFSDLDIKKLNILYNCNKRLKCAATEVACSGAGQKSMTACAPKCDGIAQCADGFDETHCPRPICSNSDYWPCQSYKCIPKSSICDGTRDCLGGEDELRENCKDRKCSRNQFKCRSGTCIDDFRRCDHVRDCPTGEDEDARTCNVRRQQLLYSTYKSGSQNFNPCGASENYFTGFGFLQYFGQPQCSSYGGFGLGFDPPEKTNRLPQRHCFVDVASLTERPEIRVVPEFFSKLLTNEEESACSVIALGYAPVVNDDRGNISMKLPPVSSEFVKMLQQAKANGSIDGFVVVTNSADKFRTIGSDLTKAKEFAETVRKELRGLNATGILLEWLRPLPSDKANFNTILKTLAETMQYDPSLKTPGYNGVRLLIGLNVLSTIKAAHDKDLILKNVDYLNVIPDFEEETKSKRTMYTNRLLSSLADKNAKGSNSWLTSDNSTLRRINVGIQLAPISWTLSKFQSNVGGQVKSPGVNGPISGTPGRLNAGEMCIVGDPLRVANVSSHRALKNFRLSLNNTFANAFAYSEPDSQWIAYETPATLLQKLLLAKTELGEFNGFYVTDVQSDDPQGLCGSNNSFALTRTFLGYSNIVRKEFLRGV